MGQLWKTFTSFVSLTEDSAPGLLLRDTPLEFYIVHYPDDNLAILNYLKGNQHTLTLTLDEDEN